MDAFDWKLLALVQEDGRAAHADLARRVGLSTSAVNARLARLKKDGVIRGYPASLDPAALGLDLLAFVHVLVDRPKDEETFRAEVASMPEIQECHHVTGEFSYLLKVRTRNTSGFEALMSRLKKLPGILRTHTMIALSTPKETGVLPLFPDTGD